MLGEGGTINKNYIFLTKLWLIENNENLFNVKKKLLLLCTAFLLGFAKKQHFFFNIIFENILKPTSAQKKGKHYSL